MISSILALVLALVRLYPNAHSVHVWCIWAKLTTHYTLRDLDDVSLIHLFDFFQAQFSAASAITHDICTSSRTWLISVREVTL